MKQDTYINPELAERFLRKVLGECYIDYSHGRKNMLVIDGVVEITTEDDEYLTALGEATDIE